MKRGISLFILCALAALSLGKCSTIQPLNDSAAPEVPPTFSHAAFDSVLQRFVDQKGRVDYAALSRDAGQLERYYRLVAAYSPDNHPELFPSREAELAYWINAYNAAVMKAVLAHYPLKSVSDVKEPLLLFFMPNNSGFFYFQHLVFGGEKMNLYKLEKEIIRRRYGEPRIHFALNCASVGCPRLPRRAFSPEHLDQELERAAREFLAEERNFRLDHQERVIYLSALFDWYKKDYLDWYRKKYPGRDPTVLNYIRLYLPPERLAELEGAADYEIRFNPYDWSLNDRHAPE